MKQGAGLQSALPKDVDSESLHTGSSGGWKSS